MNIIKRDGSVVHFDRNKITLAIKKALEACDMSSDTIALSVTEDVVNGIGDVPEINQESVLDLVEDMLMKRGLLKAAKAFIRYRERHALARNSNIELYNGVLDKLAAKHVQNQNANIDENSFGGRMGEANILVLKDVALKFKMSDKTRNDHVQNIVYQHDSEHWSTGMTNCLQLPIDKILKDGFTFRQGDVRTPKHIESALQDMVVAMQLQETQMFGGVACQVDFAMVPYVKKAFKWYYIKRAFEDYILGRDFVGMDPGDGAFKDFVWKYPVPAEWYNLDDTVSEAIKAAFAEWYMKEFGLTEEDFTFSTKKLNDRRKKLAIHDCREEAHQAIEAVYHNLVAVISRAGSQLAFTSVDFGCCTEPEGRLIIEQFIRCCKEGIGKNNSTAVFPISIFICKKGVNLRPGDPNYDLFRLALDCTAHRLYPTYLNGDWSNQQAWLKADRDMKAAIIENELTDDQRTKLIAAITANPTAAEKLMLKVVDGKLEVDQTEKPFEILNSMGCVSGDSIIDYKIGEARFVENFERAWARLASMYTVQTQPDGVNEYIDTPDVSIYDCVQYAYVQQYRIIRNTATQWLSVDFSGGRYVNVTTDHPFEIKDKGVVLACDVKPGDIVYRDVCTECTPEDAEFDLEAWLSGLVMCDASIAVSLNLALGLDEKDILDKAEEGFNSLGYVCTRRERHRGPKGDYAELYVRNSKKLCDAYTVSFEGNRKLERRIPNSIFSATRTTKLSFMAGMIDADGYINDSGNTIRVQLGSTNPEIALGQMLLAKDIGLNAVVYKNHYNSNDPSKIRYRIEFPATYELFSYLVSEKKRKHLDSSHKFIKAAALDSDVCSVVSITPYAESAYSYDVTTASEHFTVNGIYSHNCRTMIGFDVNADDSYRKAIADVIAKGDTDVDILSGAQKPGRGNIAPVTIILPELAMMANKDVESFMQLLELKIQDAAESLMERLEIIKAQPPSAAPFMYGNHTMAGYVPEEGIVSALKHGTFAIGQLGLAEALQLLIGTDHTTQEGMELAKRIEQLYKQKIDELRVKYKLNFGTYASPEFCGGCRRDAA